MSKRPPLDPAAVSDRMRRVRSQGTGPELAFQKALREKGVRFRVGPKKLAGKPDLFFSSARLAVFIDGDYWHGHQWRQRGLTRLEDQFTETPARGYWLGKIRRNMARDMERTTTLLEQGHRVLRFWESDLEADLRVRVAQTVAASKGKIAPDPLASRLPPKTFLEFFAGIGLMRLGLEAEAWRPVFANDLDPKKQELFQAHFGPEPGYLLADVHRLDPASVPAATLATASFPCTDLSLAGARRGLRAGQSSAFWGLVRVLEGMEDRRPPLLLIENVVGFLSSRRGADFKDAMAALTRLGYALDAFILDARAFTPQSRKRLFVVATARKLGLSADPDALDAPGPLRPAALIETMTRSRKIVWRPRRLPEPEPSGAVLADVLDDLPPDAPEWWSHDRAEYLLDQMSDKHREQAQRMIAGRRPSHACVFRRMRAGRSTAELRTDGLAGCLRTPRGGSSRQVLFTAGQGDYRARLLTPRECARLMGAPDYRLGEIGPTQALFGFGDAVCAPAVGWIARHYLNPVVNEATRGKLLGRSSE